MNHSVHAGHGLIEQIHITNVATVRENSAAWILELLINVFRFSTGEVVVNNYLSHICFQQLGNNLTPYKTCSAND